MNQTAQFLDRKTLFLTGATGFLGQPLVEKILYTAPGVARIHVLIRPKRQSPGVVLDAAKRLEKELFESSVFDRLRAVHGSGLEAFLREKLVAVPGDIAQEGLGLDPQTAALLRESVDIVINSAAVVSFDAPLDAALELNVLGARRVAAFAASCRKAILVHVSTAYVSGATHPIAPETVYHTAAPGTRQVFPRGQFAGVEADLGRIRDLVARCEAESRTPRVEREFMRVLLQRARSARSGRTAGRRKAVESLRRKWLENRLIEAGMSWARSRGWNDTYTYTKALGEQMVLGARGDVPTVIVRPSVIESSLSEPVPGWLDGLRMADPLIAAIGKGRLRALPLRPEVHLDLVPVDMVVNALLAALPRATARGSLRIYQVATGSRNPIALGELYDLIYRYFARNPMLDRSGQPIRIRYLQFPNMRLFHLHHRLRRWPLARAERLLERLDGIGAAARVRRRVAALRAASERLYYYGRIYEPYLNIDCRFEVDETMALFASMDDDEREAFDFDVTRLNWRHYVQNVHIPGVKRFILKMESTGASRREAPGAEPWPATIPDLLARSAARFGDTTALQIRRAGEWERVTYADLARGASSVAERLHALGLRRGDRVVLFAENQPEWGQTYMGAASLGCVVVPLDAQTWQREVWSVARFVGARALLVSPNCFKRLAPESLLENERAPAPLPVLDVLRHCADFDMQEYPRSTRPAPDPAAAGRVPEPPGPDDPASIIFTSGTASDPKGAVHTHRGFLANAQGTLCYAPPLGPGDQMLSVLPLYHALEFTCGFLAPLGLGATVTYTTSLKPKALFETMRETGTSCMLGVPTLHALLRDDVERRILKRPAAPRRGTSFPGLRLDTALERRQGRRLRPDDRDRVRQEFGGRIRFLVSGGSSLGTELYEDFAALGIPIYEGYGLTETAPVLTFNPDGRSRAGSVGKPLPGVELRLARIDREGHGEIVVRSPSLMREYFRNPKATAKAIRDGWLYTGDLGWVDEEGYVYISGRVKDVIVTGAGKNVYPADLEAIYAAVPGVREVCVVGVRNGLTEEVHAAIVPDPETAARLGMDFEKTVRRELALLARELPSYHRLQYVHVWGTPLPRREDGELARDAVLARIEADLARRVELVAKTERKPAAAEAAAAGTGIEAALLAELARLSGVAASEIRPESDLYADLGLDSLEAIELLLFVENHLGVAVPDEQADGIRKVDDLLREVSALAKVPAGSVGAPREALPSLLPAAARSPFDRALLRLSLTSVEALYRNWFDLRLPEAEDPLPDGPYIIAANHSSHLDVGAIMAAVAAWRGQRAAEKLHVLGARDYFFNKPFKSWFFSRFFNVVPIRREQTGLDGLRTAKAILSNGEPVLIFPEATRSRSGKMQAFKPGLGLLAYETNVPVVPAYIQGTYQALPPGEKLPRRHPVRVRFGAPIPMDRYRTNGAPPARDELYRRIATDVRSTIEQMANGAAG